MADDIREIAVTVTAITPKTRWIFVTILTSSGLRGIGEATAPGKESAVVAAFKRLAPPMLGKAPSSVSGLVAAQPLPDLAEAAAASALDQAAWDVVARAADQRLAGVLRQRYTHVAGGGKIGLYGNINRRTLDRSPAGFASSAQDALAGGHEAIKIAPFDEATAEARQKGQLGAAIIPGLERMRAVRDAIGRERRLMVDCHWRLDRQTAERVLDAGAEVDLHWLECPLLETPEHLQDIRSLRTAANARGIKLAGCEEMIKREGFAPYLKTGAYDVIMPDAKYVGGIAEMLALFEDAARHRVQISLHNPSGPVCHVVSLHICASMPDHDLLETQFDETPLFDALASPAPPCVERGKQALPPGPGLGVSLDPALLARVTETAWACRLPE